MKAIVVIATAVLVAGCGRATISVSSSPEVAPTVPATDDPTPPTTSLPSPPSEADPAPQLSPPDHAVLTVDLRGGCFMGGRNCPRYVLQADGTFSLFRLDYTGTALAAEGEGTIDPGLASRIRALIAEVDFSSLRAGLGPGRCNGCVDGIDTTLVFETGGVRHTFSSLAEELDAGQPIFAAAFDALAAMEERAQLAFVAGG